MMKKILNFVFLGFLIFILYLAWITVPYGRETVACFEKKTDDFDEVEFLTRSRGWDELSRCRLKQSKIYQLEACLNKAEEGRNLPAQVKSFVFQVMPLILPGSGELRAIQDAHDQECADYPNVMFRPPQPGD